MKVAALLLTFAISTQVEGVVLATIGSVFDPDDVANKLNSGSAFAPATGLLSFNTDTYAATFNGQSLGTGELGLDGNSNEFALFTFSDFFLPAGVDVSLTGSRNFALLSQGNATIESVISYTGAAGTDRGIGSSIPTFTQLVQFTNGGPGENGTNGGNGGVVVLVAQKTLTVSGEVISNGGGGGAGGKGGFGDDNGFGVGGIGGRGGNGGDGGAGGAIILAAPVISLESGSSIQAEGGGAGNAGLGGDGTRGSNGGGDAGSEGSNGSILLFPGDSSSLVDNGSDFRSVTPTVSSVPLPDSLRAIPEPSSTLLVMLASGLLFFKRRR